MRKIKFRAWDKKIGEYHYSVNDFPGFWEVIIPQKLEPEQYTGLKDKNGQEIYEGDILSVMFNPHYTQRVGWDGGPDAIALVFWDFCGFRLRASGEKDSRYADFWDFVLEQEDGYTLVDANMKHTEVIGNIHENPELLK